MAIIKHPAPLSLSGNLKKFIISSGSPVSFVLKDGETTLLDASYQPGADGRVTIDVKDIVESRLSFTLSHENFYEQPNIVKTFTALIDAQPVTFRAIRAGVANLADTTENWLKQNFLTWQPFDKQVTYYSPEWLTYYAVEAATIKLKAYFPDNTEQTVTIGSCGVGKAFTSNLQYAVVAGLLGQMYPSYYEVWAESAAGIRLTYAQRYLYSEPKSEQEQWFLFENSLGGIDTLRAYGDTDFEGAHEHKIATIDGSSSEYLVDTKRFYNKNTGYLNEYERPWLLDFFPSKRKYVHFNAAFRNIVVTESDVKYSTSDLPSSYNFKYRFADDSAALLNLIRNADAIPANITIPDIDSPDFILPPRLSEYPRVQLHEGVLFPVFDPFTESPMVLSAGQLLDRAVQRVIDATRDKKLTMRFDFSHGWVITDSEFQTTVTVHVYRGLDEITLSIPYENWNWIRTTSDPVDDTAWNSAHNKAASVVTLSMEDFGHAIYIDRKCEFTVQVIVPDTLETISETLRYAAW